MSSVFTKNRKELAGVKVIPASEAWERHGTRWKLRPDVIGKVESNMPNMILKANLPQHRTDYVEDVSALPKRTKQELVGHFYDEHGERNARVVGYLIRTDPKSKTSKAVKSKKNRPRT